MSIKITLDFRQSITLIMSQKQSEYYLANNRTGKFERTDYNDMDVMLMEIKAGLVTFTIMLTLTFVLILKFGGAI